MEFSFTQLLLVLFLLWCCSPSSCPVRAFFLICHEITSEVVINYRFWSNESYYYNALLCKFRQKSNQTYVIWLADFRSQGIWYIIFNESILLIKNWVEMKCIHLYYICNKPHVRVYVCVCALIIFNRCNSKYN